MGFEYWLATRDWAATGVLLAAIALPIAITTLALLILERIELANSRRRVRWSLETIGVEANAETGNEVSRIVRLTNLGTTAADIITTAIVGTERLERDNLVPGRAFPAGRIADLRVQPCTPSEVWLMIVYVDTADERWWRFEWLPLTSGPLMDERHRQLAELPRTKRARRRRAKKVVPVGPGGAPHLLLRAVNQIKDADLDKAMSLVPQGKGSSLHR